MVTLVDRRTIRCRCGPVFRCPTAVPVQIWTKAWTLTWVAKTENGAGRSRRQPRTPTRTLGVHRAFLQGRIPGATPPKGPDAQATAVSWGCFRAGGRSRPLRRPSRPDSQVADGQDFDTALNVSRRPRNGILSASPWKEHRRSQLLFMGTPGNDHRKRCRQQPRLAASLTRDCRHDATHQIRGHGW